MAELAPGSVVAGYRIEEVAGRGGMGGVYRATQLLAWAASESEGLLLPIRPR